MNYDFGGKVALVTGASGGIGRATALGFAASGAAVVVSDVNDAGGEETVALIVAAGGKAVYQRCNVAEGAEVKALVARAVSEYGRLDFAHNNAGIEAKTVPLAQVESDNWRKVIDVNLSSVFYCLKAEIPVMVQQGGGAIVNTASAAGLIGGFNLSVYTAAKHGVVGLTKAAAMDYATHGVRINSLCPGAIDTPFLAQLPKPFLNRLIFGTPMTRLGQPEEMAQAVLWLCSDAASYVTGHALSVDGGTVLGGIGTRFDDLLDAAGG